MRSTRDTVGGAHPLCGRTGTKNPAYSDVLYVEESIAPEFVNIMPEATLRAFADHGEIGPLLDADASPAEETLRGAEAAGIDLPPSRPSSSATACARSATPTSSC